MPGLTVVVPVYNEAPRLEANLRALLGFLAAQRLDAELVCVDDGSTDGSDEVLARFSARAPGIRVLSLTVNRGKGAAVRQGMLEARGTRVVFMDADLSTGLEALPAALDALGVADVVIGSRRAPGAHIVTPQGRLRELLGRGFSFLAGRLIDRSVADFTCGFKAFTADAGRAVFSRARVDGWAFDVELVAIARALGLRIASIPVEWRDDPHTKVRLSGAVLSSFVDLARIGWRHRNGRPGREPAR